MQAISRALYEYQQTPKTTHDQWIDEISERSPSPQNKCIEILKLSQPKKQREQMLKENTNKKIICLVNIETFRNDYEGSRALTLGALTNDIS